MNDVGMGIVVTMRDMFSRNAAKIESSMDSLDAQSRPHPEGHDDDGRELLYNAVPWARTGKN